MGLQHGLTTLRTMTSQMLARLPGESSLFGPPRKIVPTANQWYGDLPDEERIKHAYHRIAEEKKVLRQLPRYADEPIQKLFVSMQEGKIAERFVAEIAGGRYWGRAYGYIIAPGDKLIADVSPVLDNFGMPLTNVNNHDGLLQPMLPTVKEIAGKVVALNTLFCSNFHHFLLDTLPKLDLIMNSGISLASVDHFVFDYVGAPYQNAALNRLGIATDKIICSNNNTHLHATNLIVPSYSEPGARPESYQYSSEGMQFVRELFLEAAPQKNRRILLSRRLAACRRWLREEQALPHLQKMGFERIELETLPLAEQAKVFSEAECVIMPHGGGLANCVFCSPGTKVIELFDPGYLPTFMMPLSHAMQLEYHALVGQSHRIDIDVPAGRVVEYAREILS